MDKQSELGLGTHQPLRDAGVIINHALERGCRYIDTAPNYGGGTNQLVIGTKLSAICHDTDLRTLVNLSTKVGFLPQGFRVEELNAAGVTSDDFREHHSLSPVYIKYQTRKNLEALQCKQIDVLFLHNPEVMVRTLSKSNALDYLLRAFEACEELFAAGSIRAYGIASWRELFDRISLDDLDRAVSHVFGKAPGFSAIQVPVSLVRSENVISAWLNQSGVLLEANNKGFKVFASSPLHNGELMSFVNPALRNFFSTQLTAAQVAINFVRSTGLVDVVLLGTNSPKHFDEIAMTFELDRFEQPTMQKALSMLV